MIEIKNLYHRYIREYYALYDINLNIKAGEKVALVGTENSGKTSLIRILAKLEKFSAGEIYINEINIKKINYKNDVSVGYIPVHPIFFNKKSVYYNLKYILKSRKVDKDKIDKIIDDTLKKFNLTEIKDKNINQLSLYEKYALSMARLSMRKLSLVLIDNIFESLSIEETQKLTSIINKYFGDEETTLIIATSNNHIASNTAQRKIYFKLGSVVNSLDED